jgi:hypothetical protein
MHFHVSEKQNAGNSRGKEIYTVRALKKSMAIRYTAKAL